MPVFIGASPSERRIAQIVRIDADVVFESSRARGGDLDASADYAALHAMIVREAMRSRVALLEELAELLLARVTVLPAVLEATIRIAKPSLFAGATPSVVLSGRRARRVAIGLGGNLGDVAATFERAVDALRSCGSVTARSRLYRSEPWGGVPQPAYLNAALLLETRLTPHALLASLKRTERDLGRTPGVRYGPRALDCDYLFDDDVVMSESNLVLPHPRLAERVFVLAPLAEIAPEYRVLLDALPHDVARGATLAEWPSAEANGGRDERLTKS